MTRNNYGVILWLLSIASPFALIPYLQSVALFAHAEPIVPTLYGLALTACIAMSVYGFMIAYGMNWAGAVGAHFLFLEKNPDLKKDLFIPGLVAGILCAAAILLIDAVLPEPAVSLYALARNIPPAIGFFCLFFCIVNQEVILSLFMLSGIAVLFRRFCNTFSHATIMQMSIVLAALLFAIAHFPLFFYTTIGNSLLLMARIMMLTFIAGTTFGYLFWKKSFETAIWAHVVVDFVLFVLVPLYAIVSGA